MFFLDWEKSYPLLRGIDSGALCNTALAAKPRVARNEGVVSRVLRHLSIATYVLHHRI